MVAKNCLDNPDYYFNYRFVSFYIQIIFLSNNLEVMEIMIYILVFLFAIFIQYIVIKNAINDSILKDILYEIRKKSQTKSPPKPTTDNLNSNENWNIEEVGDPEIRKLYESDN